MNFKLETFQINGISEAYSGGVRQELFCSRQESVINYRNANVFQQTSHPVYPSQEPLQHLNAITMSGNFFF